MGLEQFLSLSSSLPKEKRVREQLRTGAPSLSLSLSLCPCRFFVALLRLFLDPGLCYYPACATRPVLLPPLSLLLLAALRLSRRRLFSTMAALDTDEQ